MLKKFDGAKVTKFREQRRWTKTHLGKLVGLSQQSITDIEYNRNKKDHLITAILWILIIWTYHFRLITI